MRRREQTHARPWGSRTHLALDSVVAVTLVVAVLAALTGLPQTLGLKPQGPAQIAPPAGLGLGPLRPAPAVAAPLTASTASPAAVARALTPKLRDARLGRRLDVLVTDLTSGQVVYRRGTGPVAPASTAKLLTTVAALQLLGPMKRFSTSVVAVPAGVTAAGQPAPPREIALVGGGDPLLASRPAPRAYPQPADLRTLAARTAQALARQHVTSVRLGYDTRLFSGPAFNPRWPATYRSDGVVPPITSLWVDEGKQGAGYSADPARQAAQVFAHALRSVGVKVTGNPKPVVSSPGALTLASVQSPPLGQIIGELLANSDNNAAEVVAHHVGLAAGTGGSFVGGVQGVVRTLRGLGIDPSGAVLYDGSGLSRQDRVDPSLLMAAVRTAASPQHPRLRQVVTGVPIAAYSGSLSTRFFDGPPYARGRVRAKTGTLSGINALAGVLVDRSQDVLGFVVVANGVDPVEQTTSRDLIDAAVGALAACACGTHP